MKIKVAEQRTFASVDGGRRKSDIAADFWNRRWIVTEPGGEDGNILSLDPGTDRLREGVNGLVNVIRAQHFAPVTDEQLASVARVPPDIVREWHEFRDWPRGPAADRVEDLASIVERLATVMKRDYIPTWLATKLEILDGATPFEAISNGDGLRVAALVSELESPGAV